MAAAYRSLKGSLARLGLTLSKCELWWPTNPPSRPAFPGIPITDTTSLLGTVLGNTPMASALRLEASREASELQGKLFQLEDEQTALLLLRSCLSSCKVQHLLRTTPPDLSLDLARAFDTSTFRTLEDLRVSDGSGMVMDQLSTPIRQGGLGFIKAASLTQAAYIGSMAQATPLIRTILGRMTPPLPLAHLPHVGAA